MLINVYYDENDNRAQDLSEGIQGLSIRILDGQSNQPLGQLFTDPSGYASLTVAAPETIRVSIPYLNFNQTIKPPGDNLVIKLNALRLPSIIP